MNWITLCRHLRVFLMFATILVILMVPHTNKLWDIAFGVGIAQFVAFVCAMWDFVDDAHSYVSGHKENME